LSYVLEAFFGRIHALKKMCTMKKHKRRRAAAGKENKVAFKFTAANTAIARRPEYRPWPSANGHSSGGIQGIRQLRKPHVLSCPAASVCRLPAATTSQVAGTVGVNLLGDIRCCNARRKKNRPSMAGKE
jgi:hypothetical protein